MNRIALGSLCILTVPSEADGYRMISNYLNFNLDPATSSDFQFAINHRRPSRIAEPWQINRLMKWSVGNEISILIGIDGSGQVSHRGPTPTEYGCMVELDINSVPRPNQLIRRDVLVDLLDELLDLSIEIIRDGDVV